MYSGSGCDSGQRFWIRIISGGSGLSGMPIPFVHVDMMRSKVILILFVSIVIVALALPMVVSAELFEKGAFTKMGKQF